MSKVLKGILKTLTVSDNELIFKPKLGKETIITISDVVDIKYCKGTFKINGYLAVCTADGKGFDIETPTKAQGCSQGIMFQMFQNENALEIVSALESQIESNKIAYANNSTNPVPRNNVATATPTQTNNSTQTNTSNPIARKISGALYCPKCKGTQIQLWDNSKNIKEFQRTGLNLNPLHPLTPFKTKTIKKEKTSMAKVGLGLMTGGTSLLITGTKKKKHNEYFCQECGHRWIGK